MIAIILFSNYFYFNHGLVAQLGRVSPWHGGGLGFNSRLVHHFLESS